MLLSLPSTLWATRCRRNHQRKPQVVSYARRRACHVVAFKEDAAEVDPQAGKRHRLKTKVCIIGSGPAAHTAAIYTARAELQPIVFEGFMANGIAAGGLLTTTSYVENFPGFKEPILGIDLMDNMRAQSMRHGTRIFSETVERVDLGRRPFTVLTDQHEVEADTVVVATGASPRKLVFPGSSGPDGFWGKGISACAICDGSAPWIRNNPVAVIGGGDSAMEEAHYLAKFASKVFILQRFSYLEASKIMQRRALSNPKIEVLLETTVVEAYGDANGNLAGLNVHDAAAGATRALPVVALFYACGHVPATKFLQGQLKLDAHGFVVTRPGSTSTSVPGVFAAGDVQNPRFRQAIVAAGTGCMAALEAEEFLQEASEDTSTSEVAATAPAGASAAAAGMGAASNVVPAAPLPATAAGGPPPPQGTERFDTGLRILFRGGSFGRQGGPTDSE